MSESSISLAVNDLDLKSIYPSIMRVQNSSRETLSFAMFQISGGEVGDIQRYFSNLVNLKENAVMLCSEFHHLPTYREMFNLVKKELETEGEQ